MIVLVLGIALALVGLAAIAWGIRRADAERRNLALERQAMYDHFAALEQAWAGERAGLLDRIQSPATAGRIWDGEGSEAPEPSDREVDEQYVASGAGLVEWDPELAPLPGEDGNQPD